MKKILSILTIVLLTLPLLSLKAEELDVTGDWELTMTTQRGERTQDIHFEQDGENLTVTMTGFRGNEVTGEGTIKGNKIEWTITRSTPRGEMTITYTGEVEDDKMSGQAQMGSFRTIEWNATRKEN